jgi:RTA1 like protein
LHTADLFEGRTLGLFIILFLLILYHFHLRLQAEVPVEHCVRAHGLIQVIVIALVPITIPIIVRLVEYASGLDSSVPRQ